MEIIQNFLCKYILLFAFLFVSSKESLFQGSYSKITVISRTKVDWFMLKAKLKKKNTVKYLYNTLRGERLLSES